MKIKTNLYKYRDNIFEHTDEYLEELKKPLETSFVRLQICFKNNDESRFNEILEKLKKEADEAILTAINEERQKLIEFLMMKLNKKTVMGKEFEKAFFPDLMERLRKDGLI